MTRLRVVFGGRRVGQVLPSYQIRQISALDETADAPQSSLFSLLLFLLSSSLSSLFFSLLLSLLLSSSLLLFFSSSLLLLAAAQATPRPASPLLPVVSGWQSPWPSPRLRSRAKLHGDKEDSTLPRSVVRAWMFLPKSTGLTVGCLSLLHGRVELACAPIPRHALTLSTRWKRLYMCLLWRLLLSLEVLWNLLVDGQLVLDRSLILRIRLLMVLWDLFLMVPHFIQLCLFHQRMRSMAPRNTILRVC